MTHTSELHRSGILSCLSNNMNGAKFIFVLFLYEPFDKNFFRIEENKKMKTDLHFKSCIT